MTLDDVPVFSMLKNRLDYLANRQRLIAENVANADTPGYAPRDLKPFKVTDPSLGGAGQGQASSAPLVMTVTSGMHLAGAAGAPGSGADEVATPDSESTLNGNSVVLEEEMEKMSESRTDFEAAIGFYQQSMSLLQMAAKRPGQ